jgi:hypothetical protein
VSAFQFREFGDELRAIPFYNLEGLIKNMKTIFCLGFLMLMLGIAFAVFWAMTLNGDGDDWWIMLFGPLGGFTIFKVIICASQSAAVRKIKARGLAVERVVQEWNTKCFYPASYSLAAGSKNAYFILTNNDNGPANFMNIVAPPPAIGGYPGIPSGYAPGQPQPVGQQQPMFMGQVMPSQNAQPYVPSPNSYMPVAKGGANFEYPNANDGSVHIDDVYINKK